MTNRYMLFTKGLDGEPTAVREVYDCQPVNVVLYTLHGAQGRVQLDVSHYAAADENPHGVNVSGNLWLQRVTTAATKPGGKQGARNG